jgi:phenylacetate-CoA ligase
MTLDGAHVASLLSRLRGMPTLRDRYTGIEEFRDFPILTKDHLRTALPDTLRLARQRDTGSLVLGSGGTTSAPKLSLIPSGMFVTNLERHWSPLGPDDILVNYDTPGRLCSSHNFFNRLAHITGAIAVPLGAVEEDEMAQWLDFVDELGATALNATQTHVARILEYCEATGRTPPALRTILWTGEPFGRRAEELVRTMLPGAQLYGCYGSTETWVIGHNGPSCPLDVFHVLPYQYLEIDAGQLLVTSLHPDVINPIVRYRVGDRAEFVECGCGRPGSAVRVLGRDDTQFKFLSILVSAQEIADAARTADITGVQVALIDHGSPHERAELRLVTRPGSDDRAVEHQVRDRVLRTVYRLGYEVRAEPAAFAVRAVPRLTANQRSQKTPLLVLEESHA